MLKLIGAVVTGLLTMAAAAYFITRPKEYRGTDLKTVQNLGKSVVGNVRDYFSRLSSRQTQEAA